MVFLLLFLCSHISVHDASVCLHQITWYIYGFANRAVMSLQIGI
jgi:hypothetical protein